MKERDAISDATERAAIQHVADKLRAAGLQLKPPHQSAVRGKPGKGTLARLAAVMGVEINLDIRPRGRRPKLATRRAQTDAAVADFESQDAAVSLASV